MRCSNLMLNTSLLFCLLANVIIILKVHLHGKQELLDEYYLKLALLANSFSSSLQKSSATQKISLTLFLLIISILLFEFHYKVTNNQRFIKV